MRRLIPWLGSVIAAVSAGVSAAACSPPDFQCTTSSECIDGKRVGTCEAVGFCSFPDSECASGRRFGDYAGDSSDECVADATESRFLGSVTEGADTGSSVLVDLDELPAAEAGVRRLIALASSKNFSAASITGWTRLAEQCSARDTTGISLWVPDGDPGASLTASYTGTPASMLVSVLAFETPGRSAAPSVLAAGNFFGVDGSCDGTDSDEDNVYQVPVTTRAGLVILAIAPRNRDITPESGTTLVMEQLGSVGNETGISAVLSDDDALADGVLSGELGSTPQDWAAIVLVVP